MKTPRLALLLTMTLPAAFSGFAQDPAPTNPPAASVARVDYATRIKPIFEKYCYQCHGNGRNKAGVRLDVKADAMKHIIAGDPVRSDVYHSVTRGMGTSDHMPPVSHDQPAAADIAAIKLWIEQGADWPDAPPK
jgi:mono/diheme cytochrome c family protein